MKELVHIGKRNTLAALCGFQAPDADWAMSWTEAEELTRSGEREWCMECRAAYKSEESK